MHFHVYIIVSYISSSIQLVAAQYCKFKKHVTQVKILTFTLDVRNTGNASSQTATLSFSSIEGPLVSAYTYGWKQKFYPTTVGTVMVTVNVATNETLSTTIYHTNYDTNGTQTLFTRTDTDTAGTVTEVISDLYNKSVTVTYPTNYLEVSNTFTWDAILPTIGANGSCCHQSVMLSPTPTHTPFTQSGSVNAEYPQGWLYTLQPLGYELSVPNTRLPDSSVSSLWTGQSITILYTGCPYTACGPFTTDVSGASFVVTQANLLATSTTTISSPAAVDASPTTGTPKPAPSPTESNPTPPISSSIGGEPSLPRPAQSSVNSPPQEPTNSQPAPAPVQSPGSTIPASAPGAASNSVTTQPAIMHPPITIGTSLISANPKSEYIVGGQILMPGGSAIVVGGTTLSLAPGASQLVEGTQTAIATADIGGTVWSVIGGSRAAATSTGDASVAVNPSNSSTTFLPASEGGRVRLSLTVAGALFSFCVIAVR